jgi:hypothetical protein
MGINTANQNCGKAEYFYHWGLTRGDVICPSRLGKNSGIFGS